MRGRSPCRGRSPSATSARMWKRCPAAPSSMNRSPAADASATCCYFNSERSEESAEAPQSSCCAAPRLIPRCAWNDQIDGDVGALSGGWKMRVAIAKILLGKFDVLLLDEPTNHLDIESIVWLERFLKSVPSTIFMTSHDRDFMNRTVTRLIEIDAGEIVTCSGNYDFYVRERELREANQEAAYARQQAKLAKEQRFIERFSARSEEHT